MDTRCVELHQISVLKNQALITTWMFHIFSYNHMLRKCMVRISDEDGLTPTAISPFTFSLFPAALTLIKAYKRKVIQ